MTNNPFIKELKTNGHSEMAVDRKAFALALAEVLHMTATWDDDAGRYAHVWIEAGEGLQITVTTPYGTSLGRVELRGYAPDERPTLDHNEWSKLPSITVDSARPIEALAKDIQRRLIEPARPVVDEGKAKIAAKRNLIDQLAATVASLKAEFPALSVDIERNGTTANVYLNRNDSYITGTLWPDGHINLQRVSLPGADKAKALIALALS